MTAPPILARACAVCSASFIQPVKKGARRKCCSDACTRERIRQRCRRVYAERYPTLIAAGASREIATWAARGGRVRFEAAHAALQEAADALPTPCEWNPTADRPSQSGDPPHADATVSLGADGDWHLCEACAALPRFARFRTRKPLRRAGGTV